MQKIIFDTNFLMIPAQFKVDIFSEVERIMHEQFELCVVDASVDELRRIQDSGKGKDSRAAKLALTLVSAKKLVVLSGEELSELDVDSVILEVAKKHDAYVATQDRAFKRRLRDAGIRILCLRKRQYIDFETFK